MNTTKDLTKAAFDPEAKNYDDSFTNSWIGRTQRLLVRKHLDKRLRSKVNESVLELNCGTGEDAYHIAQKGHKVLATDISSQMIEVATSKQNENLNSDPGFLVCDIRSVYHTLSEKKFDLVFSNFGGLNCLSPDELKTLRDDLHKLLSPEGRLVFVIMGRKCIWENLYFRFKGRKDQLNRRMNKNALKVHLERSVQDVWYYDPKEFSRFFIEKFSVVKIKPIGLFIPPSYLEPAIKGKKIFQSLLLFPEKLFGNSSSLANYADHFLIELRKR